jgi:hypothetical protein
MRYAATHLPAGYTPRGSTSEALWHKAGPVRNFRELRHGEVPRTPLPRTWVNKGRRKYGSLTH